MRRIYRYSIILSLMLFKRVNGYLRTSATYLSAVDQDGVVLIPPLFEVFQPFNHEVKVNGRWGIQIVLISMS